MNPGLLGEKRKCYLCAVLQFGGHLKDGFVTSFIFEDLLKGQSYEKKKKKKKKLKNGRLSSDDPSIAHNHDLDSEFTRVRVCACVQKCVCE